MLIHAHVTECDLTDTKYNKPVAGGAFLARGATGRWCQVLRIGPDELAKRIAEGEQALTHEQAVAKIQNMPGHNTIDF